MKGWNSTFGVAIADGASPRERIAGPPYCANSGTPSPRIASADLNFKTIDPPECLSLACGHGNSKSDAMLPDVSSQPWTTPETGAN
jgi:hypothetical protein